MKEKKIKESKEEKEEKKGKGLFARKQVPPFRFENGVAINVKDMDLFYGDFKALKKINMAMPEKQITAMIGPSGCGKSTLLKSLNRMNDLVEGCRVEGEITIGGENIYEKTADLARLRKNVGMVFQRPNPFAMSVYDNIAYGPRTFGIKKKSVLDEIVERSLRNAAMWEELKDRLGKSALGLSGGQQQRLCIARALAVEPQILLMDEPLSALDGVIKESIKDRIRTIAKEYNLTTIIVTHDPEEALTLSDRVMIVNEGMISQYGRPEEIITKPKRLIERLFDNLKANAEQ